jgi:hypothetical protein
MKGLLRREHEALPRQQQLNFSLAANRDAAVTRRRWFAENRCDKFVEE